MMIDTILHVKTHEEGDGGVDSNSPLSGFPGSLYESQMPGVVWFANLGLTCENQSINRIN